ncbi:MAG: hypothetical protein JRJ12_06235 [Deltaproteobacteria bacterium]|nr:hypothetical protein [Deltaproteobacteria bacterium]MBW2069632.1 hypothetical protein [Deltaproteobacteria bacterium]
MKIFILGTGKSGTTALLYKVAGGLPNCQAFSGGRPGKYVGDYQNAVYKHTYEERKGKTFDLYLAHLQKEAYDRKIWMARDPRDVAVSRMLYRWHRGYLGSKKQYQAHLDLVLKKEQDPASVPFHVICRYSGHNGWPRTTEEVVAEEERRYKRMSKFVRELDQDWFIFTYEQMVAKNFDDLNSYLGFQVKVDTEVPRSTGKAKVVRKKATGDWRHWFTPEDVELFKPVYLPYMEVIGYDCEDWALSQQPVIEPEFSSQYMQSLPRRKSLNSLMTFKDLLIRRLRK